ncbi:MAG: ABC transporter ATP-binding protein [Faecalibacterium sp.]
MNDIIFNIKGLEKTYKVKKGKDVKALSSIDLSIEKNEFICVVGPSGCGKTTLMNVLAGLEPYDAGEVTIHGQPVLGPGPDRTVVFQQYALYPWMTVKQNIMFPLKFQKRKIVTEEKDTAGNVTEKITYQAYTKQEKEEIASHYIKMVALDGFEDAYPSRLSGGMKQRVAIARSYVGSSDVLLMDEPFGAVDAQTRAQLQEDLLHTWTSERKTCFFITHDVEEAVLLATRVIVMSARPARIKKVFEIDIPYPRTQKTKMDAEFIRYKNMVWEEVYQEYLEVKK